MLDQPAADGCPCGSGLRPGRCCGGQDASMPGGSAMGHLAPLAERAMQAARLGQAELAACLCTDILELAPLHPDALRTLYRVRLGQGREAAADALLRRCVRHYPNQAGLTVELGRRLLRQRDLAGAETQARNAVRVAPTSPEAHNLLGMVFTETHRPAAGEHHYRRVLALTEGRPAILLANLAWSLKLQGRMAEARALYEESVQAEPAMLQTWLGWARLEEADRQFDAAAEKLDRAAALAPGDAGMRLARAILHGRARQYQDALLLLDRPAGPAAGSDETLERGRLLDKLGRHDAAFAAFEEGKRLAREGGSRYQEAQAADLARRLRGFFAAPRLQFTPRAATRTDVAQPIFVLGFPRSGTTLVEQTLSAHSRIAAGDELQMVANLTGQLPRLLGSSLAYPEALAELWMGDRALDVETLRDVYLQQARQHGAWREGAAWFTDKMPLNETHLGLIALMFPAAPLIHVVRHPLDVVLSVFSHQLTHGFCCAFALESIARHYVLITELVEHYRAEMALRYLQVRYEDMVADQRATVARLLAFIGEEFEPACLQFEQNRRYARTASYAQVTEPLYRDSQFRYRNYRRHLEPVLPILRSVIERLGYSVAWARERRAVAA